MKIDLTFTQLIARFLFVCSICFVVLAVVAHFFLSTRVVADFIYYIGFEIGRFENWFG